MAIYTEQYPYSNKCCVGVVGLLPCLYQPSMPLTTAELEATPMFIQCWVIPHHKKAFSKLHGFFSSFASLRGVWEGVLFICFDRHFDSPPTHTHIISQSEHISEHCHNTVVMRFHTFIQLNTSQPTNPEMRTG